MASRNFKGDEYTNTLENEVKDIDRKFRLGFQAVKRDIDNIRKKASLIESGAKIKMQLNEIKSKTENFVDKNDFDKNINQLSKNLKNIEKDVTDKISKIESNQKTLANKETVSYDIEDIKDKISAIDVKKIDLSKIDAKVNSVRNDFSKLDIGVANIKSLQEDFVKFRRDALTRYNFDKLENWIKLLEKDMANIVGGIEFKRKLAKIEDLKELNKEMDSLCKKMDSLLDQNKEVVLLKSKVEEGKSREKEMLNLIKALNSRLRKLENEKKRVEKIVYRKVNTAKNSKSSKDSKSDKFYNWLNK